MTSDLQIDTPHLFSFDCTWNIQQKCLTSIIVGKIVTLVEFIIQENVIFGRRMYVEYLGRWIEQT